MYQHLLTSIKTAQYGSAEILDAVEALLDLGQPEEIDRVLSAREKADMAELRQQEPWLFREPPALKVKEHKPRVLNRLRTKQCGRCGQEFVARSGIAKWCRECSDFQKQAINKRYKDKFLRRNCA